VTAPARRTGWGRAGSARQSIWLPISDSSLFDCSTCCRAGKNRPRYPGRTSGPAWLPGVWGSGRRRPFAGGRVSCMVAEYPRSTPRLSFSPARRPRRASRSYAAVALASLSSLLLSCLAFGHRFERGSGENITEKEGRGIQWFTHLLLGELRTSWGSGRGNHVQCCLSVTTMRTCMKVTAARSAGVQTSILAAESRGFSFLRGGVWASQEVGEKVIRPFYSTLRVRRRRPGVEDSCAASMCGKKQSPHRPGPGRRRPRAIHWIERTSRMLVSKPLIEPLSRKFKCSLFSFSSDPSRG